MTVSINMFLFLLCRKEEEAAQMDKVAEGVGAMEVEEKKVEEDVLEVLDALLELELVLVTLELTECLLSPLARPPPSPRPPTPSWMEHLDRATFISATPDLFRRLTFLSVW